VRICSLLPSATEIVCALGMGKELAAVTHECDYPPQVAALPRLTRTNIPPGTSSAGIDAAVTSTLETTGSLYELDLPLLEKLKPDLILTQRLCDVCAVSFDRIQEAILRLPTRASVLNLEPHSLADILGNIRTVGQALGCVTVAENVVSALELRIEAIRQKTIGAACRLRALCLDWVNPLFGSGHWMKELVEIAGGRDEISNLHRPSQRIEWGRVIDFSPQVIILTCCGFNLDRCKAEAETLAQFAGIAELPAVIAGRVFATDGSSYFSRPGPRIVDSLEILAHLIHPEIFAPPPNVDAFARVNLARSGAS
jgi:iron complex transport system substrate-binding protein